MKVGGDDDDDDDDIKAGLARVCSGNQSNVCVLHPTIPTYKKIPLFLCHLLKLVQADCT
jgi:hypothetical protein